MKIIATITLFFICASSMTVSAQYNLLDPKLFATGRLEFDLFYFLEYGTRIEASENKYTTISPQYKKIANQSWISGNWKTGNVSIFNAPASNCEQPYSIYYGNNIFDSIIMVNGRRAEVIQYDVNANAQRIVYQRAKYYYSNTGRLDSLQIKNFDPVDAYEFVYRFSTDAKGRMVYTTGYERKFYEYDANGNISRFVIEGYDSNLKKWVLGQDFVLSWTAGKITSVKTTDGSDSVRLMFYYVPNTINIKNIAGERKKTGGTWIQTSDLVVKTKNAKGYPTRIDYRTLGGEPQVIRDYSFHEFVYYPNDTLLYQSSRGYIATDGILYTSREIYEYCGVPVISPTPELQPLDVKIYPNPTNDVLNIEIPENTEGPSIEIFNAMGIMVSKTKQLNIDVSILPTGIYFVQIKTKNRVGVKRFMVNRT